MNLKIQYFAMLREQRGASEETLQTDASTPGALYAELRERYAFALPASNVRAAVNGEFCAMDAQLADGDEIVFIPPVAGG